MGKQQPLLPRHVTRAQIAEGFAAASKFLMAERTLRAPYHTDKESPFICHCLDIAFARGKLHAAVRVRCCAIVELRVGRHTDLSGWLYHHQPHLRDAMELDARDNKSRQIQATRKAWLEDLVREFSQPAGRAS